MSQQKHLTDFPPDIQIALFHYVNFSNDHGKKACRKFGVGDIRKGVGKISRDDDNITLPDNVIPLANARAPGSQPKSYGRILADRANAPYYTAIDQWRLALAALCSECGACRWSRRAA